MFCAFAASGGADVVETEYNTLGQEIYRKDQGGNIVTSDYDTGGRLTHRKVTTVGSGFDGTVLRITSVYNSRGQVETVTQFNTTTVGTPDTSGVLDQVKYSYEDWGHVSTFEQDRDGVVGGGATTRWPTPTPKRPRAGTRSAA